MRGFFFLLAAVACAALACSGDDGTGGSKLGSGSSAATGSDGKVHPAADNVLINEAEACKLVRDAILKTQTDLKCVGTIQDCPSFLRATYVKACMKYDHGTAQGCADYFAAIKDCNKIIPDECVLVAHPETEGQGC